VRVGAARQRVLQRRINHVAFIGNYCGQDFLLFPLRHIEVVECFRDLRSYLVELF